MDDDYYYGCSGRNYKSKEYDRVNYELKDIAWKLYDLNCDFKDLKCDALQLYCTGRYDNYENHKNLYENSKRFSSSSATKEYENYAKEFTKQQREDEYESRKRKCLEEFERALQYRRNRFVEEVEAEFEKTRRKRRPISPTSYKKSGYSSFDKYEGLSSEELEQCLREKMSALHAKTKCMKESFGKQESSNAFSSQSSRSIDGGGSKNNVICCRGKQHLRNFHSPHRVYLDGGKTYVVNHTNSKVIFVPKTFDEY